MLVAYLVVMSSLFMFVPTLRVWKLLPKLTVADKEMAEDDSLVITVRVPVLKW